MLREATPECAITRRAMDPMNPHENGVSEERRGIDYDGMEASHPQYSSSGIAHMVRQSIPLTNLPKLHVRVE